MKEMITHDRSTSPPSPRAATIAKWFGLPLPAPGDAETPDPPSLPDIPLPILRPGQILFITGPSGSGKSTLFRRLRAAHPARRWLDVDHLRLPAMALVDCFPHRPLEDTLQILGRVGLGEAWSYLRTPAQLSEGQRWRLRLALALDRATARRRPSAPARDPSPPPPLRVLASDEFAAVLDRVTAAIIARMLRRTLDASPHLCAVLASSHDDLLRALRPDQIIRCDFGRAY